MAFAITNAKEYREKTEADLALLRSSIDNSGYAINAVTSAYHLHEWLWAHVLKSSCPTQFRGVTIATIDDFRTWLDANCPHFQLIQKLTNGSKHAYPAVPSEGRISGYGVGPFGVGPFSATYLLIDLGAQSGTDRYLVASTVIEEAATFMIDLSKSLGS